MASQIRQKISRKLEEKQTIERFLLEHREMIAGCLIERRLGTSVKKRSSPAYYLSGKISGKTILRYVKKGELRRIKEKVSQWRVFNRYLVRWWNISNEVRKLFRELGRVQSDEPFKKETKGLS
ncbi:MAG: hypothetical protein ACOYWZ_02075 [Bacillota bacterium]